MGNIASSTVTGSSQSQLSFLDHPSNQEASPEGQTALRSLSNVCPIRRNYKTS